MRQLTLLSLAWLLPSTLAIASNAEPNTLKLEDVFTLEYANQIALSANGDTAYFVRNRMDIQSDRQVSNIWQVDTQTKVLRPVTSGLYNDWSPKLSPDGSRIAFISDRDGKPQIFIKWLDTGALAQISHLDTSPSQLLWSPNGKHLYFQRFVEKAKQGKVSLPGKPKGAKWAEPARYIDDVYYRFDGAGYAKAGNTHVFRISSEGGNATQITHGEFDHSGSMSINSQGDTLYLSANRHANWEYAPTNSEIYQIDLQQSPAKITAITDRVGPDTSPSISPNGRYLAYTGYDDKKRNYENADVYLKDLKSGKTQNLTQDLDRNIEAVQFAKDGSGLYFHYDDQGKTTLAFTRLNGQRKVLTDAIGSTAMGRPYSGGHYAVSDTGHVAFTLADVNRPADVALLKNQKPQRLTQLNQDALASKKLAKVEPIWVKSSHDDLAIQGWVAYPPGFDKSKKYPLILEIHGGPVANYGPHFSTEVQLFAASGYVVLYMNPRGSDSYGAEFAHTIHHNYPSNDYDDLMTGVDALIAKGFIDEQKLFVTGGSGGGVLTSWIIGKTDRFAAAVVAKPVINWYSFVLTADFYPFFTEYWFSKKPWEDPEQYIARSPISLVGNVTTPTMLLTGEADYRTPISETEQYYQALKLQKVKTAMVRIPDASHGITRRPSNLMSKVAHILWWFENYDKD